MQWEAGPGALERIWRLQPEMNWYSWRQACRPWGVRIPAASGAGRLVSACVFHHA